MRLTLLLFPVAAQVLFLTNGIGLYIHIPFCESKCSYCNFYSFKCGEQEKDAYLKRLISDGGMPSAHSATVIALAVMSGWTQGFGSAAFAISMILAVVIMRDAVGVRRESGVNASIIKLLAKRSNSQLEEGEEHIKTDMLKELVGHTPLQVACGCIIGLLVGIVYIWIGGIPMAS